MSAKSLTSFVVGIGLDSTDLTKGIKNASSSLNAFSRKTKQIAGAIGGAFAFTKLKENTKDMVGKFSDIFGNSVSDIQAFGDALDQVGAKNGLSTAMDQMEQFERMRAMTPNEIGSKFAEAGIKGVVSPDVILKAKNATDLMYKLADAMKGLDTKHKIRMMDTFNINPDVFRLLEKGSDALRKTIAHQKEIRTLTKGNTDDARKFNKTLTETGQNFKAIGDWISNGLTPIFTSFFAFINKGFDKIREFLKWWRGAKADVRPDMTKENKPRHFKVDEEKEKKRKKTFIPYGDAFIPKDKKDNVEDKNKGKTAYRTRKMLHEDKKNLNRRMPEYNNGGYKNGFNPDTPHIIGNSPYRLADNQTKQNIIVNPKVEVHVELDGKGIESTVKKVTQQQYTQSKDDIDDSVKA